MVSSSTFGGFDVQNIVSSLMQIERRPVKIVEDSKTKNEKRASALKDIQSKLTALKTKLAAVTTGASLTGKTVTTDTGSGQTAIASATATGSAANGNFKVWVDQLATATTLQSNVASGAAISQSVALENAGFSLKPTSGTFSINGTAVTIDAAVDSLTDVVNRINSTVSGVTATVVNDSDGRPNKIELSSVSPLQLGSGGDTSNFLASSKLLAAQVSGSGPYTATSTGNLGVTRTDIALQDSRLATAVTGTGSFKINGQTFSYNASADSMTTILNKINSSTAGVTATYDSVQDKISIRSNTTGSIAISMEDVSGNFLAATNLTSASQSLGENALYRVDSVNGGAQLSSTTNTINGVISGVSLSLKSESANPITFSVAQDTSSAATAVKDFVTAYNAAMDQLRSQTTYSKTLDLGGALSGDSSIKAIESKLRETFTTAGTGLSGQYKSFADLGITFGAIGSVVGQTKTLVLDEAKLKSALEANPNAVSQVFGALTSNSTLAPGGTSSVTGISGTPTNNKGGSYEITTTAAGEIKAVFTPSDGSSPLTYNGTITAGGTNTSLIPGMTLTAGATLVDGTSTIAVANPSKGVGHKAVDYLTSVLSASGLLQARLDSTSAETTRLTKRLEELEERMTRKQEALTAQYSKLNSIYSQLQQQAASISSQLSSLSSYS